MKTLLVLGATSDIARATALEFARDGWNIFFAGRNIPALERCALDLAVRSQKEVLCFAFDACQNNAVALWDSLPCCPDAVLCVVGLLEDQEAARHDVVLAERIVTTNFTGLLPILARAADVYEERGSGLIIGVSSVAGDRGRASNYVYGSAKAGFTMFLSGLRQRLHPKGVQVLTVKPGFVATSMTEGMPLPPLLTAQPEEVARDIIHAVQKKRDIVYSKWFWKWIMRAVCLMPEVVFKKISF